MSFWIALTIVWLLWKLLKPLPKPDPTCGGRIVPRTVPIDARAAADAWTLYRAAMDDQLKKSDLFESPDQARRRVIQSRH